jgi:PAS domain S-box-containing protein
MRPKDYDEIVVRFRQASSEPYADSKILEYAMLTASGDWAWVRSTLIILTRDENGMAVDMMFIMTDITEQITSNEALRQSEERFREVSAAISHQIYMMDIRPDQDPEVLYVSSNVDQLTGYPAEKFLTIPRFWGKYVAYPEDIGILRSRYDQLMNGEPTLVEYRIVRADGKIRWIQDSARARPTGTPGTWRVYGVLQDITDFKIVEEHLHQQQKLTLALEQERQLNTIKNSLMVTLSHEFRTPLSTILTSSEMIERYRDKLSPDEFDARLRVIQQQVQHLTNMLDDISVIVKTEIGKIEFNPTPINLFALFKEVVDEVRMGIGNRHHFVITNDDISIPVLVDIDIIRPVLMNLLVNAVKYSPEGSEVYCHIAVTPYQARITIQDQGVGIPEEDLPHVFEPFHRGKNVVNITGTGLGLKIVKDFVELQQGLVKIDSIENEGTTVTLTLPVAT